MSLLYPYNSKYNGTSIDQKCLVRKDMDVNLFVFVVIEHYKSNQNNISHLLMGAYCFSCCGSIANLQCL